VNDRNPGSTSKAGLLLTAAGSSRRMGGGGKKEYRSLNQLPVLIHSLLPFLQSCLFSQFVITIPGGDQEKVRELLGLLPDDYRNITETIKLAEGGDSRQKSVLNGLEAFEGTPDIVLIHDAARPCIHPEIILEIVRTAEESGACIPVVPATDAMKHIDSRGIITTHLKRNETVCAQTPQGFNYSSILKAHHQAREDGITCIDDSEIYSNYIGEVRTVSGSPDNVKITFPADLERITKEHP